MLSKLKSIIISAAVIFAGAGMASAEATDELFFGFQRPSVPPRPEHTHSSRTRPRAGPGFSPRQYRMFPEGDSYLDFNNYLGQPSRPHSWHFQGAGPMGSVDSNTSRSSTAESMTSPPAEYKNNEWRGELAFEEEVRGYSILLLNYVTICLSPHRIFQSAAKCG